MQEPTAQIGWVVTILLAGAAIVANTLKDSPLGISLLITLLAICAVLAVLHEGRGKSS